MLDYNRTNMAESEAPNARRRMTILAVIIATIPCYCIGFIILSFAPDSRVTPTPTITLTSTLTSTPTLSPTPLIFTSTITLTPTNTSTPTPTFTFTPTLTSTSVLTQAREDLIERTVQSLVGIHHANIHLYKHTDQYTNLYFYSNTDQYTYTFANCAWRPPLARH